MKDVLLNIDSLRLLNADRLERLHQTPITAIAFDVHGFTSGKDSVVNDAILAEQAKLLGQRCLLAAVTAFGDRIHLFQTKPLLPYLQRLGLKPEEVPLYLSTRNGALTTHAYTNEVLDAHPLTDGMFKAIISHPLVKAIHDLTPQESRREISKRYEDIQSLGFSLHPRHQEFPGIQLDWNKETNAGYQLILFYKQEYIKTIGINDSGFHNVCIIAEYCGGRIPDNLQEMAAVLKQALARSGIIININSASFHPVLPGMDIARLEVNKSLGCAALLPVIANHWGISGDQAKKQSIGGGDSPTQNDRPLIDYFDFGVTNVDYWDEGEDGPIVLDYPDITDQVRRTLELFRRTHTIE